MSTTISTYRWRLVVAALLTIIPGIVFIAVLSISGMADPVAGWEPLAPPKLVQHTIDEASLLQVLRIDALPAPPLLIEVSAPPGELAAWGVWLQSDSERATAFMIDPQQRSLSATPDDWQPFIHITPTSNAFLVQVDADGAITWRINGEIAWAGRLSKPLIVAGIRIPTGASPKGFDVHLYAPAPR